MYQYNAQHTGYNDKDSISVPLQLIWKKRFLEKPHWIQQITAIGDRIIVTNDVSVDYSPQLHPSVRCISVSDSTQIWMKDLGPATDRLTSQATYYNNRIYVIESYNENARVAEYDLESGAVLTWYTYTAQYYDQIGPTVFNNKLLFPAGIYNGISCVDLATATQLWWDDLPQIDLWAPAAVDSVVFSWTKNLLSGHHIETGKYLWFIAPHYYDSIPLTVSLSQLREEINSKEKRDENFSLEDPTLSPPFSWSGMNTAAVIDTTIDMIYTFYHNGFYALSFEKQKRIWKKDLDYSTFIILSTPSVCNGKVYNIFLDTLIAMDGLSGDELWRYPLDTLTAYSTVIANGLIFASTQNKTIAIDIVTHEKVWEYPAGGYLTIANNKLFISSITGDIYVFGRISTDIADDNVDLPNGFALSQNYPNPFNPLTEISFSIPNRTHIKLTIYNILGEEIKELCNQVYSSGIHRIEWDGTDNHGGEVSSGLYLYTIQSEKYNASKKMILLK